MLPGRAPGALTGGRMKNPFLIGEQVYLRPIELEDAPQLQIWINDPRVTRTLLLARPWNLLAEREWIEKRANGPESVFLAIALRADDEIIGTTGLQLIDWRNRHASFGIVIGEPDEWGRGYGREATALMLRHAFETLNLHRVWLHVYDYNERGIRAYESVGFRREGVLREGNFREGRYSDVVVMGILRGEWSPPKPAS
jgi:RimJ/RimL family protein N-acetyltransferase